MPMLNKLVRSFWSFSWLHSAHKKQLSNSWSRYGIWIRFTPSTPDQPLPETQLLYISNIQDDPGIFLIFFDWMLVVTLCPSSKGCSATQALPSGPKCSGKKLTVLTSHPPCMSMRKEQKHVLYVCIKKSQTTKNWKVLDWFPTVFPGHQHGLL